MINPKFAQMGVEELQKTPMHFLLRNILIARRKELEQSQVMAPQADLLPRLVLGTGGERRGIADLKLPTINLP